MTWRPVSELVQPVVLWWRITGPQGHARIKIEVDLMGLVDNMHPAEQLLKNWWRAALAPLVTISCEASRFGVSDIATGVDTAEWSASLMNGYVVGTTSTRADSVIVTAQTAESNQFGRRRIYFPFLPASWHNGNTLSDFGFKMFQTQLRGIFLGCDRERGGPGPRLIVYRKEVPADRWNTYRAPAWAPVKQLIVNSYLDRAPVTP